MSDAFHPLTLRQLMLITDNELTGKGSYFGIPESLFFDPRKLNPDARKALLTPVFSAYAATPLGVAAGPHSQLAHNITGAWLMGARYIELKTIQVLDELEVPRPCIDMQDEGYNCEWSQELLIEQSYREYLHAWVMIHWLNYRLGFGSSPGLVFNMSAGYDLKGIRSAKVQWFFDAMADSSQAIQEIKNALRSDFPELDEIEIPSCLSDNITLSTMHGCPAHEIQDIATFLICERKLHTYVKLNPTLLGAARLRTILNDELGFATRVPYQAFDHDLKYNEALAIIEALLQTARESRRHFGLKLTNTLESENHRQVFSEEASMMYMSGRALHPLSVNLAALLQQDFQGKLDISFSGGADAFHIRRLMDCGFVSVTVCTDLLKPGGYMRLHQYIEELLNRPLHERPDRMQALSNLKEYAIETRRDAAFKLPLLHKPDIKTKRKLSWIDCISAPCRDHCATAQDIPEYLYFTETKAFDKAFIQILKTNPFPAITGMVCDHLCQLKCTRINYDEALQIREVKRFISEQPEPELSPLPPNGRRVAIVGAGPSGLSCAFYLAMSGFGVEVFEERDKAGGMVRYAIPGFRLTDESIDRDFNRLFGLGVSVRYNHRVDKEEFIRLRENYDYVFVAAGAQLAARFYLPGLDVQGVLNPLDFLYAVKAGKSHGLGRHVLIIGGGNTAMDTARTAWRLVGDEGSVSLVYRRSIAQMPADKGEIRAVLEEGIKVYEMTAPSGVMQQAGRISGLVCTRIKLGEPDDSGRPRPVPVPGSEFVIACDTLIPATGQETLLDFADSDHMQASVGDYKTPLKGVFLGGDALRGASTAINAIADGRKIAEAIMHQAGISETGVFSQTEKKQHDYTALIKRRARRLPAARIPALAPEDRRGFSLIEMTASEEAMVQESARCLHCDEICNICTTVCPNFANVAWFVEPFSANWQQFIRKKNGDTVVCNQGELSVKQPVQILNLANFCNECGNCQTFCPTSSAPWSEKARLHLNRESFDADKKGYLPLMGKKGLMLLGRDDNEYFSLQKEEPSVLLFSSGPMQMRLDEKNYTIIDVTIPEGDPRSYSSEEAIRMHVLLNAIRKAWPEKIFESEII